MAYAKEHPFKVSLDFDTRFRVWKDQILRDRLLILNKTRLFRDGVRYYELSVKDYARLYERLLKEFFEVTDNPMTPQSVLSTEQHIYRGKKESLRVVFCSFSDELFTIELRGE